MAKFVFRMQSLLSVKDKIETQRRMEYGRALAKLEAEKQKLKNLEDEKTETIRDFSQKVKASITPDVFALYNTYLEVLKNRIIEQIIQVQKAEKEAEEKWLILIEAMKEKKMLEKLKEKDLEEFKDEEKRIDQRLVDAIVSYKYANETETVDVE